MGSQRRPSNEMLNGTKTWSNVFNMATSREKEKSWILCLLPTTFIRNSFGRTSSTCQKLLLLLFFFCDNASGTLYEASTFNMGARVRKCAIQLQDIVLLAKLSASDLISQETLYNKALRVERKNPSSTMNMLKAIKITHRDILAKKTKFNGTFESNSQQHAVPESLRWFYEAQDSFLTRNINEGQTTLCISQLMLFNSTKRRGRSETSTSLYLVNENHYYQGTLALWHAEARKRTIVDDPYNLGLSISYDSVLEISTEMGIKFAHVTNLKKLSVRLNFKKKKKVSTTAAVDNINHNPSSSTAQGAFHGKCNSHYSIDVSCD